MYTKNKSAQEWFNEGNAFFKSQNFEEAAKCYAEADRLVPDNADIFNNWGSALSDFAQLKQDESLFREAFEKYTEAARLNPEDAGTFYNWGIALYRLAKLKQDELLFCESIKKYAKSVQFRPNDSVTFFLWGHALYYLAKLNNKKESPVWEELKRFEQVSATIDDSNTFLIIGELYFFLNKKEKATECFFKAKKDILEIFAFLDKENREAIIETDILSSLLGSAEMFDGKFFEDTTKDITDEETLRKYKDAYILSVSMISQLHVNFEHEELLAHYTDKATTEQMLLNKSKLWLSAVNYSNDPKEGKTLLDCLFGKKQDAVENTLIPEYGAFAGCFIFNYDRLNQFRLYGTAEGVGTGLSLVFKRSFFSAEAKMAMSSQLDKEDEVSPKEKQREEHPLFRCMYVDPVTWRVETVGHKEAYLFYRENNEKTGEKKKPDDVIEKEIEKYKADIAVVVKSLNEKIGDLKRLVENLDPAVIGQLLINLRYLTKHIAFNEEQECRILRIHRLDDTKKVQIQEDLKKMYIEYLETPDHVEKVYFGPKATDMAFFQDKLIHNGMKILCKKSENPLA